jgi:hypothetical protein
MVEDVEQATRAASHAFNELVVGSREELMRALSRIAAEARLGLRPILHFECHGSRDQGLLLSPSGEYVSWDDLVDALREINIATANNLCVVFGVCFGLRMSLSLRLSLPSPYYITIAPEEEISVGVLEERSAEFYRELARCGNITAAYQTVLKPQLKLFHCKEVFAGALANYIASHCSGSGSRIRRERVVTATLERDGITSPTPSQLAEARRQVRQDLQPSQAIIDTFAPTFLIGRQPGFGYAELRRLADGYIELNRRRAERRMKGRG